MKNDVTLKEAKNRWKTHTSKVITDHCKRHMKNGEWAVENNIPTFTGTGGYKFWFYKNEYTVWASVIKRNADGLRIL